MPALLDVGFELEDGTRLNRCAARFGCLRAGGMSRTRCEKQNYKLGAAFATNASIAGNGGNNVITGNDGNNTLSGAVGVDTLVDGSGNGTLVGRTGNVIMTGGLGNATFVFNALNESGVGGANNDLITD